MRSTMPDIYREMTEQQLREKILETKAKLGKRLVILGHHYQRDAIVELSDYRGDSFGLSKKASEQKEAEYIVFCGVNFMAESAAILASPNQMVLHPEPEAGCPLADMAELHQVEQAWKEIDQVCGIDQVTPLTYMNSFADIKAFCGKNGGAVCTSSNALAAFTWGFQRSEKVFFLPDEHLGRNTAAKKGIPENKIILWDPTQKWGGNTPKDIKKAQLILWKGHCHVHTWFTPEQVRKMRAAHPEAIIIAHPECKKEVIDLVDHNGSTEFIVKFVENSSQGTTIAIGTEINLVNRLARENPQKKVLALSRSLCPNMYKINLQNLCWTLDNLGQVNRVYLPELIKAEARIALNRMLQLTQPTTLD